MPNLGSCMVFTFSSLVAQAAERGMPGVAYGGEVSALETWEALQSIPDAQLVDVRTPPEWSFSGIPTLASVGKKPLPLSWKLFPSYEVNPDFIAALQRSVANRETPLFFLCRTGGRSLDAAAAATAAGYTHAFNVTDGFEGPSNAERQRGQLAGWRAAGLPWEQS